MIQLHKIRQSGGFLGRLLGPLLKTGLPLIGNTLKPVAKNLLIPLGLTVTASGTKAAIHKKMFGSVNTTLLISNEEINGFMKIVKSLEESGLLIKGASETIKNEAQEQKEGFLGMLLGTLGACLSGIYYQVKEELDWVNAQLELVSMFIPSYPLTNLEIQNHYQNEPKFNGVRSRTNLPKSQ